jgi:hypothetical protein
MRVNELSFYSFCQRKLFCYGKPQALLHSFLKALPVLDELLSLSKLGSEKQKVVFKKIDHLSYTPHRSMIQIGLSLHRLFQFL